MKGSSALVDRYLEEYARLSERAWKSLREFLGNPGTSQTHALRASLRRLDEAVKVLPKKTRRTKEVRRLHERCRDLLRGTSRIRDIDMLIAELAGSAADPTVTLMLNNLREEREEFVGNSTKVAWKLFEHHPPKLTKRDLPRLSQRVRAVVDELEKGIADGLDASLKDESKIDALHSLRKDCKKLRYALELVPPTRDNLHRLSLLRRWQDRLGEIRDRDVLIGYLSQARQTQVVGRLLSAERAHRHSMYLSFCASCRPTAARDAPPLLSESSVPKVPS